MGTAIDPFRGPLLELLSPEGPLSARGVLRSPDAALPVASASDRNVWDAGRGGVDAAALDGILRRAEQDAGSPWPQTLASAAARVHRDGDRDGWEQNAFARQRRLSRASVLAASTLSDQWLDEVADGVWMLCEQSSWCWPAHDDTRRLDGSVLANSAHPFLDLGAGEVAGQLAWIDQLLGSRLDERYRGLRARIRREARARVIDPFVSRRDWHWIGLDGDVHNWNPWIHGNVLVTALRLLDGEGEADERADVVALAVTGIDRYIASLPEDGAIDEGYAYWWNGACRALEALDIVAHATQGRWDASAIPALRATVAFPHRSHLGGDWYVNHADGQARPPADQPWHALHRAARWVGDPAALAHAAAHRHPGSPAATEQEGLGRMLRGITDRAWIDAAAATSPLPREVWYDSTQVMLAREHGGSARGLALVAKGGHNAEHHNHNDVGSVIVAVDGVPVIVDAGRPTYTAATFGPDRYLIWTMQSDWHNVPTVRGHSQPAGRLAAAGAVSASEAGGTAGTAVFEAELAGAYSGSGLLSWRRTASLDRGRSRIRLDDVWTLEPWDGDDEEPRTTLHLLLAGSVEAAAGSARIRPLDGAPAVRLEWDPECEAVFAERMLDDPMLSSVWGERLTRLEIDVTDRRSFRFAVELDKPSEETS